MKSDQTKINDEQDQISDNYNHQQILSGSLLIVDNFSLAKTSKLSPDGNSMLNVYDEHKLAELQNQSKHLSMQIEELERENKLLKQFEIQEQPVMTESSLREEVKKLKDQYKKLMVIQHQEERLLRIEHQKCIILEEKIKSLKIDQKNEKIDSNIKEEDINDIKLKIEQVEHEKKKEEAMYNKKIREMQQKIEESKTNIDSLNTKVKEKDRECKISMLNVKAIQRIKNLKPLNKNLK